MSTTVSIIIPILNGESFLNDLLRALNDLISNSILYEVIFVDNRSTDNSVEIIKNHISLNAKKNYFLYRQDKIQSSYAARNLGIKKSTGEILLFTDVDCLPDKNWLINIIVSFSDQSINIVGGQIAPKEGNTFLEKYAAKEKFLAQEWTLNHDYLPFTQTANMAVRKELFKSIGLFRPHLTSGGDADFCWRMQKHTDFKLILDEKSIVFHKNRTTFKQLFLQYYRYGGSINILDDLHQIRLASKDNVAFRIPPLSKIINYFRKNRGSAFSMLVTKFFIELAFFSGKLLTRHEHEQIYFIEKINSKNA